MASVPQGEEGQGRAEGGFKFDFCDEREASAKNVFVGENVFEATLRISRAHLCLLLGLDIKLFFYLHLITVWILRIVEIALF